MDQDLVESLMETSSLQESYEDLKESHEDVTTTQIILVTRKEKTVQVIIRKTREEKELSIRDPKSGQDRTEDYIGMTDAMTDGQFIWDEGRHAYLCTQDIYEWWDRVISERQTADNRLHTMRQEYGDDIDLLDWSDLQGVDVEDEATQIHAILDEYLKTAFAEEFYRHWIQDAILGIHPTDADSDNPYPCGCPWLSDSSFAIEDEDLGTQVKTYYLSVRDEIITTLEA